MIHSLAFLLLLSLNPFVINASEVFPNTCKDCNLIIINLTSTRKKHLSLYGHQRHTTPNIDRFFAQSYIFQNAFAPASLTFTDAVSLFYSLAPITHEAFARELKGKTAERLKKLPTLPSVLGQQGYKTAAFVSDEDYTFEWGYGKDFGLYFDRAHYAENNIPFKPFTFSIGTKELIPHVINWLNKNHQQKFFLFLQAYDMHCPYSADEKFQARFTLPHSTEIPFTTECFMSREPVKKIKEKGVTKFELKSFFAYLDKKQITYRFTAQDLEYLKAMYDAELAQSDDRLKQLFDTITQLKLDKNSVIVFMADHGDNLGENGFFMKPSAFPMGNLHNHNLNFPLLIKFPGQQNEYQQRQFVQTMDLTPSLLDILGVNVPSGMQGKSFRFHLGNAKDLHFFNYAFSLRFDVLEEDRSIDHLYKLEVLNDEKWKFIRARKVGHKNKKLISEEKFLFNLQQDPLEEKNLYQKNKKIANEYSLLMSKARKMVPVGLKKSDFFKNGSSIVSPKSK